MLLFVIVYFTNEQHCITLNANAIGP